MDAITDAMEVYPGSLMVQLSALLCLIPLALDNSMMKVSMGEVTPHLPHTFGVAILSPLTPPIPLSPPLDTPGIPQTLHTALLPHGLLCTRSHSPFTPPLHPRHTSAAAHCVLSSQPSLPSATMPRFNARAWYCWG